MTPYHSDPWLTVWQGDCREVMAQMEPESVHCVVTSPPYWGLRDYGTAEWTGGDASCDHLMGPLASAKSGLQGGKVKDTDKIRTNGMPFKGSCGRCGAIRQDSQLGLEPTPEEYVANMVAVFREVRRVLRADGTCWVNLGDSYWNGGAEKRDGGHDFVDGGKPKLEAAKGSLLQMKSSTNLGLKPKDLVGIPWRVAFALQADGWYLRSDIVWSKANPMPESVTDRPTKSHEYVFLLTKSPRYYFDSDAVREGLYDLPANSSLDGVPRPAQSTGRVVTVPTLFDGPDAGMEGTEPRPGADEPTTVGGLGVGEGDQEPQRSVGTEADQGGRVSPLRTGSRGEQAGTSIAGWTSSTGAVLPFETDGDGGTVNPDGAGMGGDPSGAGSSLPVLREGRAADDGSRYPGEQGRDAHEGERGGGVPAVQRSEARSAHMAATPRNDGDRWREVDGGVAARGSGRNLRSVWHLATQPYPGAHFATFPEALVEPCVKAGTSERGVCPECGAPYRRKLSVKPMVFRHSEREQQKHDAGLVTALHGTLIEPAERTTVGWDIPCKHISAVHQGPVPAVVLDPFAGSGTTGRVAQRLGRRAVLIDLNGEYLTQTMKRNADIPLGLAE